MYGQIRKFYMIGDLRSDNGQYFVIEPGTLDDYPLSAQLAFCSSRDRNGLLSELPVLWNAPILVAQSSVKTPVLPQFRDLLFRRAEPVFYAFDILWDEHAKSDAETRRTAPLL
jgi:hypothetical protein